MERPRAIHCELHIRGQLPSGWADWLDGFNRINVQSDETVLTGQVTDQAALLGVLLRLHSWNIQLVAIACQDRER